jgi:probable poly-beta-1,6-N-acetyl-D-glucosamine export protein
MSGFLTHIHYLRGVAILMIVGVHARGYAWEWKSQSGFNFFVSLFDNGTILFVFIAGFLFHYLNQHKFSYLNYLKQKVSYVVLPYLLFSIPIIIFRLYKGIGELPLDKSFDQEPALYKVIYFFVTGLHMVPFWFMPMIFLFYLSSWLLHKLATPNFFRYIFPVIVVAGFFTYRPAHNANPILSYLHFLPVYLTGMWASHNHNQLVSQHRWILPLGLIAYLGITALELLGFVDVDKHLSMQQVWASHQVIFNIYVFKAFILCFLLMLLFYRLRNFKMPLLDVLARYSFGIYFIHFYFISTYRQLASPLAFTSPGFLLYFLLLICLSVFFIFIIKKVTGNYGRYITGS